MASTYTTNLGIEKPGTGEQSGTWGTTANTNYDLIDQAINGIVQVTLAAAGSSGSPNTIDITNGTASDGRNKYIEFVDGGDLGATAYVQLDPNDAEKIVHMRNSLSGSRSVIVFQGTYNASNDFEIPAGKDVVLKFDGGGASATVTQVFVDLKLDALDAATVAATTGNITTVNSTTVDTTNLEVTNLKAKDGTSAGSIADSTGVVTIASAVLTTADINGGTMDGVTIGGASTAAGSFTTVTASGRVTFGELKGTGATVVNTILDEDNMATNSDTALATQQSIKAYVDSQVGTVDTLAEILANGNTSGANNLIITAGQSLTTDSILETSANNGVNIDSVVLKDGDVNGTIGATTAKAANFTTVGTSSNVTVGGTLGVTGATTLTSLDVNGTVTADGLTVDGNATVNDSALQLDKTSAPTASGQVIGDLYFRAENGAGGRVNAGLIRSVSDSNWAAISREAKMEFYTTFNSTLTKRMQIANNGDITFYDVSGNASFVYDESAGSTFNEQGADRDFRVESDTDTHALFVEGSSGNVTLGSATSRGRLYVSDGASKGFEFYPENSTATNLLLNYDRGSNVYQNLQIRAATHEFLIETATRLTVNSSGGLIAKPAANGHAVFNEDGVDADFRVESDTEPYMFFIDGGNESVHINSVPTNMSDGLLTVFADTTGNQSTVFLVGNFSNAQQNSSSARLTFTGNSQTAGYTIQAENVEAYGKKDLVFYGNDFDDYTSEEEVIRFSRRGGAVFNQQGKDADFRVESDNNANMLFVDASEDTVSIGTSNAPSDTGLASPTLNVSGSAQISSGYYSTFGNPNGRVFTLNTAGNGAAAFIKLEGADHLGYRSEYMRCINASGIWTITVYNSVTSGTAPTFTIANNVTANPTITLGFDTAYSGGYCIVNLGSPAYFTIS